MAPLLVSDEIDSEELTDFLHSVFEIYGFDFRDYAAASVRRRVARVANEERLPSLPALKEAIMRDPVVMDRFLHTMSVCVTDMFRDPEFFLGLRHEVVPLLRTYPFIRIWDIGCSSGEETYSIAIIMKEEGLYDRCRIYATDMNGWSLKRAREGVFSLSRMQQYTANYISAGGQRAFSNYYTANYDRAILSASLQKNILFAQHNLVTDGSFNEFNLIVCRNVLIYFNKNLQDRVHELIHQSLVRFGILALGPVETIQFTPKQYCYKAMQTEGRFFQRMR